MSELGSAQSVKEAFIRQTFSDLDLILDKVKALQHSLPSVAGEIDEKLIPLREDLISLVGRLSEDSQRLVEVSKNEILKASENQQANIKNMAANIVEKQVQEASALVNDGVRNIVNQSVALPVKRAMDDLLGAARVLDAATTEMNKAAQTVEWAWWIRGLYFVGAGMLGGMTVVVVLKYFNYL